MSPVTPESLFSSAGEEMGSILTRTVITSDWYLCFPVHFLALQEMSVKDNYSEGLVLEGLLPTLDIFNCLGVRKCFLVDFSPQYFSVPRDALNWGKITLCWHWWKTFSCFTSGILEVKGLRSDGICCLLGSEFSCCFSEAYSSFIKGYCCAGHECWSKTERTSLDFQGLNSCPRGRQEESDWSSSKTWRTLLAIFWGSTG